MISIIVVSWNSGDDLTGCIASLADARRRTDASAVELIVVDNHSDVFPEEELRRYWPGGRFAVLSENVGFGPAVNHAAAHARGDILLLVNPDARAAGESFTPIERAFAAHADWVAIAPKLAGEGQAEFQLRRLPTLRQAFRELLLIDRAMPENRGRRRDRYLDRDRKASFEVEQPAAAVLAIRTKAFVELGGFDPRFIPAWWEDVDLCFRLRTLGKIVYYPEAEFDHVGGASMRRLGYDRFLPMYYRNAIAYWRKNRGPARALIFRLLLFKGMLLRMMLLPLRRADPRPKAESFRAYRRAIAVALS